MAAACRPAWSRIAPGF